MLDDVVGYYELVRQASVVEIEQRVRTEWAAIVGAVPSPHGLSLERNLVSPPQRRTFQDSFERDAANPSQRDDTLDLWVVADESVGSEAGYLIVFDEERDTYGLALKPDCFIGYYGSLAATIAGM